MTNLKISAKGRALLRKSCVANVIVAAIAVRGGELSSREGLTVEVNGKSLTLRAALQKAEK